ncbi:hypothetical protein HanXRQr2_Chr13g0572701 [Helianthus annuus]|uniref:Uncharacterized protein n=1 Tax=Helianthus annuus TaxID=4232 RepID=A0A9K3EF88_HELAN|nr:hypothetical protein HanXRQr2_Chr13g0572701 [Helianthus annuus]
MDREPNHIVRQVGHNTSHSPVVGVSRVGTVSFSLLVQLVEFVLIIIKQSMHHLAVVALLMAN